MESHVVYAPDFPLRDTSRGAYACPAPPMHTSFQVVHVGAQRASWKHRGWKQGLCTADEVKCCCIALCAAGCSSDGQNKKSGPAGCEEGAYASGELLIGVSSR